jgi:hypothetical protein
MGLIWYLRAPLLYQNSEVNEQFMSYFAECLCTHIYQYLCKEKHFTCRCCQTILTAWFEAKEGLQAMDSRWDSVTYRATALQSLPHQAYIQNMAKLGMIDIIPELLQDMSHRLKWGGSMVMVWLVRGLFLESLVGGSNILAADCFMNPWLGVGTPQGSP